MTAFFATNRRQILDTSDKEPFRDLVGDVKHVLLQLPFAYIQLLYFHMPLQHICSMIHMKHLRFSVYSYTTHNIFHTCMPVTNFTKTNDCSYIQLKWLPSLLLYICFALFMGIHRKFKFTCSTRKFQFVY